MSQETFARVEKKYVISREQYEWIRQFLAEYTVEDEYGQSTIRKIRKRETLCIARSCGNWNTPEINMTCDRTCISHTTA